MSTVQDMNAILRDFAYGQTQGESKGERPQLVNKVQGAFRDYLMDQIECLFRRKPLEATIGLLQTAYDTGVSDRPELEGMREFFIAHRELGAYVEKEVARRRRAELEGKQQTYITHHINPWLVKVFGNSNNAVLTEARVATLTREACEEGIQVFGNPLISEAYTENRAILQRRLELIALELLTPGQRAEKWLQNEFGQTRYPVPSTQKDLILYRDQVNVLRRLVGLEPITSTASAGIKTAARKVLLKVHPDKTKTYPHGSVKEAQQKLFIEMLGIITKNLS